MRLKTLPALIFFLLISPTIARNADNSSNSASSLRPQIANDAARTKQLLSSSADENVRDLGKSGSGNRLESNLANKFALTANNDAEINTARNSIVEESTTSSRLIDENIKFTNILKNGAIENNFAKEDSSNFGIARSHSKQPETSVINSESEREYIKVPTIDDSRSVFNGSRTLTPRAEILNNVAKIYPSLVNGTTVVYRETTFKPVLSDSLLRKTVQANNGQDTRYLPFPTWSKIIPEILDANEDERTESEHLDSDDEDIAAAADYGLEAMNDLYYIKEPKLFSMGLFLTEDSPGRYVAAFNDQSEEAKQLARFGFAALEGASIFLSKHPDISRTDSFVRDTRRTALHRQCPRRGIPPCPPASLRYRTTDGSCNNPRELWWGSAMSAMQRFLRPVYQDGIQTIRRSVNGRLLPSPREISTLIHEDRDIPLASVTHMLMQWGQFIDHDLTATGQGRGFNGTVPQCCLNGGVAFQPPQFMHPECLPIPVPVNDWFYGPLQVRCLEFVRSGPAPREDCGFGPREQLSQVTSYLDASMVYSSSAEHSDSLRLFRNGLLQYGMIQSRKPLLPRQESDLCKRGSLETSCFRAGDGRLSEQPALISLHVVLLRQHNRIATQLAALNPHWSDEKLFQESRRIIGALVQQITYREFLPIVLGPDVIKAFDLKVEKKGYYEGYDPTVNPNIANAFAAAAYRFGHSLVQPSFVRYDTDHRPIFNNVSLHNEFNNPVNLFTPGSVDRLLLGLVNQPSQKRDEFISVELTNHLFQIGHSPFGMDLASLNIQRGRDHGIPPYVDWREPCGLSAIKTWEDLERVTSTSSARKFSSLYASVEDVDLYPAGLAEKPVPGGLVGPTFACIIAQQFSNLRKGDRFWYENPNRENSFTPAQLQQIRRVTLAQILCKTMDSIDDVQPFVFLTADTLRNERIPCHSPIMGNLDLTFWEENVNTQQRSKTIPKRGSGRNKNRKKNQNRKQPSDATFNMSTATAATSADSPNDSTRAASTKQEQRVYTVFKPVKTGINQQNKVVIRRPESSKENLTIVVQNNAVNSPVFFNDPISGSNFQFTNSGESDKRPSGTSYGSANKPTQRPTKKPSIESPFTSPKPIYYDDSDERPIHVPQKPQRPRPIPKPIVGSNLYGNPNLPTYVPHGIDDPNNPNPPSYGFVANPINNHYPSNSFFHSFNVDAITTTQRPTLYTFYTTFTSKRTTTTQRPNNNYYGQTRPQNDQNYYHYQESPARPSYVNSKPQYGTDDQMISSNPHTGWTQRPIYDHSWISGSDFEHDSPSNRPAQSDPDGWTNIPIQQSSKPLSYNRPTSSRPYSQSSSRPQYWTDYPTTTKKYPSTNYYYDAEYQVQNAVSNINPRPFKTQSITIVTETDANVHHSSGYRTKPQQKVEVPRPLLSDQADFVEQKNSDEIEIDQANGTQPKPGQFYYSNNVLHRYPDRNTTETSVEEESAATSDHRRDTYTYPSQSKRIPIDSKYQIENPFPNRGTDHLTLDEDTKAQVARDEESKLTTTSTVVLDDNDDEVTIETDEDNFDYDHVNDNDDDYDEEDEEEDDDVDLTEAFSDANDRSATPEATERHVQWINTEDFSDSIDNVEMPQLEYVGSFSSTEIPKPMRLRRPAS